MTDITIHRLRDRSILRIELVFADEAEADEALQCMRDGLENGTLVIEAASKPKPKSPFRIAYERWLG